MPQPPIDPDRLTLQIHPAPILRRRADPVPAPPITDPLRLIAERMIEMMRAERGIGLAAPQAGVPWRLFVAHVPPSTDDDDDDDERRSPDATPATATSAPEVYINPRLSNPVGAPVAREEGCLSLPDIRGDVLRPPTITITALGLDGREFTRTATGLLARCWQHEVDHLDGVLIIDRFTPLSRLKNRKAVRDLERGR